MYIISFSKINSKSESFYDVKNSFEEPFRQDKHLIFWKGSSYLKDICQLCQTKTHRKAFVAI